MLGCSSAESYELALEVGDALPPAVMARIEALVTSSTRCLHGWPLDAAEDVEFSRDLVAVSALPAGATGAVRALAERNAEGVAELFGLGLDPRAAIAIRAHEDGRTIAVVDGSRRLLGGDVAAAALVARAT